MARPMGQKSEVGTGSKLGLQKEHASVFQTEPVLSAFRTEPLWWAAEKAPVSALA